MGRKSNRKKARRIAEEFSDDLSAGNEFVDDDDDDDDFYDDAFEDAPGGMPSETMLSRNRFNSERMHRAIGRYFQDNPAASIDEVNAVLQELTDGRTVDEIAEICRNGPPDAAEEAQELMFQAMCSEGEDETKRLTAKAYALDPLNPDANVHIAYNESKTPEEALDRMVNAKAAIEAGLGEEFMEENKGNFWGNVYTRPYMRLRHSIVDLMLSLERYQDAVPEAEGMLALNPNDNQGIRDILLATYLIVGDCAGARRLQRQYKDTITAIFTWGRVFERILSNNKAGARDALKKAMRRNPHVLRYLLCAEPMPDEPPSSYQLGEPSEAICCIYNFVDLLNRTDKIQNTIANIIMEEMKKRGKLIEEI